MRDVIDKNDCCVICGRYLPEGYGHACSDCARKILAVNLGCDDCVWLNKRPQKCSCCCRNSNLKDNYRSTQ